MNTEYCKGGKIIDDKRIKKYEGLFRFLIKKNFPLRCFSEASMDYDDLLNQLRFEAFKAIKITFDPIKAMKCTMKDPEERKLALERKRANPKLALENAEKNIVFVKLSNYIKTLKGKYKTNKRKGKTFSYNSEFYENFVKGNEGPCPIWRPELYHQDFFPTVFFEKNTAFIQKAISDKKELLRIIRVKGKDAARIHFKKLSKHRKGHLLEVLEFQIKGK